MSESPIFDQLVAEFSDKGSVYEEFVKFTTPEFVWDPDRPVVQLDKQPKSTLGKGVKFAKSSETSMELTIAMEDWPQPKKAVGTWMDLKTVPEPAEPSTDFGRLIQDYVSQVGRSFAEQHPLAIVTDMRTEVNDNNSATLVIEAVQPITSVKPLSEREPAEPME